MNKKFIKATDGCCDFYDHVNAPCFRRTFFVKKAIEAGKLAICGLGFYRAWLNGTELTTAFFAPYIANPDQFCYYDEYDVSRLLREGKNVLAVLLGNGMMNPLGGVVWDFHKWPNRGAPRLAVQLDVKCADQIMTIVADDQFRTHPSPILFDDLRMGEHYDARLEMTGWTLPEFDDHEWTRPLAAQPPRGELQKREAEPIVLQREIRPKSIKPQDNGYLYDFGENTAGVTKLRLHGASGQKVTLWHGEILRDGKFYNGNLAFYHENTHFYQDYNQKTEYICKEGYAEYTPSFCYYGFRYVLVQGITSEQATPELLTALVLHSDLRRIGRFSCSDETLNTLYDMAVRSDLSNFYYFPTDCPHREKNGWTGDAAASADHMVLLYDVEKSWREWLHNIRKSQDEAGAIPGIVPTFGWGFAWGNGPAWDCVLFQLPYTLYKFRGCTEVIRENANAMMRYLRYIAGRRDERGLVAMGLGDWCPVGRPPEASPAPLSLTDTIMVMNMSGQAAEMFHAIGLTKEETFAARLFQQTRTAIRSHLVSFSDMVAAGDCQTSQSMCLYYGVFDDAETKTAIRVLVEQIHRDGNSMTCGYLGMKTLFHVLSGYGESELAYHLITKPDYPSYAYLLICGETTLPEMFFPLGQGDFSHNHHFFGDISRWFMFHVAGLQILDATHIRIAPAWIAGISHAAAEYELPDGKVCVRWEKENGCYSVDVLHPKSVCCELAVDEQHGKVLISVLEQ